MQKSLSTSQNVKTVDSLSTPKNLKKKEPSATNAGVYSICEQIGRNARAEQYIMPQEKIFCENNKKQFLNPGLLPNLKRPCGRCRGENCTRKLIPSEISPVASLCAVCYWVEYAPLQKPPMTVKEIKIELKKSGNTLFNQPNEPENEKKIGKDS